jgi:ribosomal protein S18 acetylase RimI-like enzyme
VCIRRLRDYRHTTVPATEIKQLLSHAVGAPTEEKLTQALREVYSPQGRILWVLTDDDNEAIGIVGIRRRTQDSFEILHIAVVEGRRKRGMGRRMIDELLSVGGITELVTETDGAAVGFYGKYGFSMHSLGEKYPGVERFYCRYWRPE